jgi:hypothetical protein
VSLLISLLDSTYFLHRLLLVYHLKKDAEVTDTPYDGHGTNYIKKDSWRSMGRWRRAWLGVDSSDNEGPSELPNWIRRYGRSPMVMFMGKVFLAGLFLGTHLPLLFYSPSHQVFLACVACGALGMWGTGLSIKETFGTCLVGGGDLPDLE